MQQLVGPALAYVSLPADPASGRPRCAQSAHRELQDEPSGSTHTCVACKWLDAVSQTLAQQAVAESCVQASVVLIAVIFQLGGREERASHEVRIERLAEPIPNQQNEVAA
eukprot:6192880-Pleurochrysis_carterae.AAC.1